MDVSVVILRLAAALLLSVAFGLVRQRMGKPIGFGTFSYLAIGSCALALTALQFNPTNPLPLLGATVTGIGFLGAGALLKTGDKVVGFTSSATIWIFSVFGLAIGSGEYLIAGMLYGSIWVIALIDRALELRWFGAHQRKLTVEVKVGTGELELARDLGLPSRAQTQAMVIDRERGSVTLTYSVQRRQFGALELLDRLERHPQVLRAAIE